MTLDKEKQQLLKKYGELLLDIQHEMDSFSLLTKEEQAAKLSAKKIGKINKIMTHVDDSGAAIAKLGEKFSSLHHSYANQTLAHGFHVAGFFMSVFNFARIPALYLIAYLSNQKVPATLGNNARWLHSTVLLGLAIVALAVPTLAPVIAFVGAGIGLSVSVFMLGKKLYERYQLGREAKHATQAIAMAENEMARLYAEAQGLAQLLEKVTNDDEFAQVSQLVAVFEEDYRKQKDNVMNLHQQRDAIKEKIKVLNNFYVFDKSLAVAFASLSVIGLVLSLSFPGIGLGLVAGVGIVAASYALIRVATPLIMTLVRLLTRDDKAINSQETADLAAECNPTCESSVSILKVLNAHNDCAPVVAEQPEMTNPTVGVSRPQATKSQPPLVSLSKTDSEFDRSSDSDESSACHTVFP